jgi:hypothetical protein
MESLELVVVCGAALLWVFGILLLLALLMRLIIRIFPAADKIADPAVLAALAAALQVVLPGTKVTKIEEGP